MIASCCSTIALNFGFAARANETCEALRAELAQTPTIISNVHDMRLYAGAITRQNFEIRKTQQNMQRLGCSSSVSVLNTAGDDICQDMQTSLDAMQDNKQKLSEQRDRQGHTNPHRQDLLAALQANDCDAQEPELPTTADTSRPYEAPAYPEYSGQSDGSNDMLRGNFAMPLGQSGYRTLCVRTCDGAFFPISPNTPPAYFGRDAAQCQRMCPGAQTELYYSKLSQEAEDMVSATTGQPYRDKPYAFSYRNRAAGQPAMCGCSEVGTGTFPTAKAAPSSSVINITTNPTSKLEKTKPAPVAAQHSASNAGKTRIFDAENSHIRQVGPAFFPTPGKDLDLKHPALEGPQPVQ